MCGIIGYVGSNEAAPILLNGLQHLEYRGYDSGGIAILHSDNDKKKFQIHIKRAEGKLANLQFKLDEQPINGRSGIGHTRWATHGVPSEFNAHPHSDCTNSIAVVHNGIIENYLELKRLLQSAGHNFKSDTDTEVISHLIEHNYCAKLQSISSSVSKQDNEIKQTMFMDAVRFSLQKIVGGNSILIISSYLPDSLIACKIGSAGGIAVGYGDNEMYVASDVPAVLEKTRKFVFLSDRDLAIVTQNSVRYFDLDGHYLNTQANKQPQYIEWDIMTATKAGYPHFMLKEIFEQSQSIANTLSGRLTRDPFNVNFDDMDYPNTEKSFHFSASEIAKYNRIILIACGTPWHACLVAKSLIQQFAKLPVDVIYAHEFRYEDPLVDANTLVVAVTQSGETVDVLVSMAEAKRKSGTLLSIVNVLGSTASREAHGVIYIRCGPEFGVAETKAFTSHLVALTLFAIKLGIIKGTLHQDRVNTLVTALYSLPNLVHSLLSAETKLLCESVANKYSSLNNFLFLGRGLQYPIALEGALKLKEISYVHAEGYAGGEMKHGPIALIEDGFPVVAIAVQDSRYSKMLSQIEQARARGGSIIAIGTMGDELIASKAHDVLWVPKTEEELLPILTIIPLQLLAYYIGIIRGCDVDHPRNLAKSVTVE